MKFQCSTILRSCLAIFISTFSFAQAEDASCDESCHCVNNLTPAGIMVSHVHPKNEWMFSYRYMDMGMQGVLSGTKTMDEFDVFNLYLMNSKKMRMDMHMLMGMYGITDRFTAMVMLNYNVNSMEMSMLTAHDHDHDHGNTGNSSEMLMKTNGIGDSKLYLLYGLIKNTQHQLVLGAGLNLPTGSVQLLGTDSDMMYEEKRMPYMMQLGAGTWDIFPSLTYTHQQGKLAFSVQASGTIRPSYNSVGYKYGNEATVTTWFAYNWWNNFGSSIRLEATAMEHIKGNDKTIYSYNELAANPMNYGGKRINAYLGLTYGFKSGFLTNNRLGVEYGLPVYQNLNGMQMQSKQVVTASWSYLF